MEVSKQLDYDIPKTVTGQCKYVNFQALNQINSLDGAQQTFQVSTDTNSINLAYIQLQLKLSVTGNADHDIFYRRQKGPIKRIQIKSGSNQILYEINQKPEIFAVGKDLIYCDKKDKFRKNFGLINQEVIPTVATHQLASKLLKQFSDNQQLQFVGSGAGAFQLNLEVSLGDYGVPDKYISLQDSMMYIYIEYQNKNEMFIEVQSNNNDANGTLVAYNRAVDVSVSNLRVKQQWLPDINNMIKKAYLEMEFPYDFVSTYVYSSSIGQYNITLSKSNGQMIKGVLISLIKTDQVVPSKSIANQITGADGDNFGQLNSMFVSSGDRIQNLQVYFDSQLIEYQDITQYYNENKRSIIEQKLQHQYWIDLGHVQNSESGYTFGDGQAYNLNVQFGFAPANQQIVFHVIGQKYLKQAPGQVIVY